jgi:SpoVK/Ycf46/Vps4 family AAA+-type ATPase
MPKNDYFKNVYRELKKETPKESAEKGGDFSNLKILEYWVRFMDKSPECVNKEVVFRLVDAPCRTAIANDILNIFGEFVTPKKKRPRSRRMRERGDDDLFDDDFPDFDDSDDDDYEIDSRYCSSRLLRQVSRYWKERRFGNQERVTENLLTAFSTTDADSMAPHLYSSLQKSICTKFKQYALGKIREGIRDDDSVYARSQKVKKVYRLTDAELEIVLYIWLRNSDQMEVDQDEDFFGKRHHHFGEPEMSPSTMKEIAVATGLSEARVSKLLGKDSSLRKLNLCNEDLNIPLELQTYLNGFGDISGLKAFNLASPATIPFCQLQEHNPDANLALELIRHHGWNRPLNILFYGVEGAGKTELAKALAKEAGLPLWEVCIDGDNSSEPARRFENRSQALMLYRIRAAMLADWHCEKKHGIIMIDEADLVLNGFEKGSLNHFFESVKTPIIWITNSISYAEKSSRRRFDFSIAFKGLAKDERYNMLESVLRAQEAETLLTPEEKMRLVVEYPAMAGGYTLAVRSTRDLIADGADVKAYPTMVRLLNAHTHLLGIENGSLRDVDCRAPAYSLEGLNIEGSASEIIEVVKNYDSVWKTLDENSVPTSLNILLYGPPGSGKTEFVRHIARTLGRNLVVRRASDLLGMYVGQTEANIAEAFEEAERTKSILFFDEADSFLRDRSGAMQGHEVSKVNEILTRMENFKGIFIAATNFNDSLDTASRRRFALKLGFGYLKPEGIRHIWNAFFPHVGCPATVENLPMLTPGDFNAVNGRLRYLPESSRTADRIEAELRKEVGAKDSHAGRTMGF